MPRYLAIDYGRKRTGLAYADELGVPFPLPALLSDDRSKVLEGLRQVAAQRRITDLVIGRPDRVEGGASQRSGEVEEFIAELRAVLPLPVHQVDEALTSWAAEDDWRQSRGRRGRRPPPGEIDSRAAVLILRDFLGG